jgi:RES domain-containing protein
MQMTTPHPDFPRLAAGCIQLVNDAAKPWPSVGFRLAALKYGHSDDLLSGEGAIVCGGRMNGRGAFPVIYTSTDPHTATAEAFQNFAAFGFAKDKVRPRVLVGIEVKVSAVLDLSNIEIRRRLGVNLQDLAQPWWPMQEAGFEALTQAIGRAARDAGFEAVILPSARRKGGINFNVFPDRLRAGSSVAVIAENDLRRYLK